MSQPLLAVNNLTHLYAPGKGFSDVSFELFPGKCWASSASPAPAKPPC
nr:phosphonate C-P lyase system protein PhnK [Raoultella sp. NCTC 9187]